MDTLNETSVIERLTEFGREATKYEINTLSLSQDTEKYIMYNPSYLFNLPKELLLEASKHTLADYYNSHLLERRKFFRRIPVETIMQWSSLLITEPLLKLTDNLTEIAVKIFKNLVSYMGDRKSVKQPIENVKKHLRQTFNAPEDLKDESYVQVLKQITHHTD
jgi:hypothetical protein